MISRSDFENLRASWEIFTALGAIYTLEIFLSGQCKKDYGSSPNLGKDSILSPLLLDQPVISSKFRQRLEISLMRVKRIGLLSKISTQHLMLWKAENSIIKLAFC